MQFVSGQMRCLDDTVDIGDETEEDRKLFRGEGRGSS